MGRAPCCDKTKVKRGPWSPEEDSTLKNYVEKYGTGGNWIALPHKAGLKRCGKSCRLRWLNYLRPDIKHGGFTEEEDNIIITLYRNIGSRWSVIASQLPGRTDNDVKNYWNTKLKKKLLSGTTDLLNPALVNDATNPRNFNSNPVNFASQQAQPIPFTKQHPTNYYGNSTTPSIANSNTLPAYQMNMFNSTPSTEFVSEMFYNESIDNLPLPRLMEVQENGTTYNNSFTTSSSQEISSLSPSYSLGTSTYASNWSDNTVGEEVGFLMELGSKSSYSLLNGFDYQQEKLIGAEEIDISTSSSSLVNYSYSSTSSLLANISETEPSQGLHHHQSSNISN